MNKQEAIEKIKRRTEYFKVEKEYNRGFRDGLNNSIPVIREIDAPERPVVPQYVADWIEWCKRNKVSLLGAMSPIDELGTAICDDKKVESLEASKWATRNQETFAQAWLFGYEVEKEKLYTAKLKLTNEYLGYESQLNDLLHYKVPDSSAKEVTAFHFTEDDLVKYHIWGNDTYEVTEVEE